MKWVTSSLRILLRGLFYFSSKKGRINTLQNHNSNYRNSTCSWYSSTNPYLNFPRQPTHHTSQSTKSNHPAGRPQKLSLSLRLIFPSALLRHSTPRCLHIHLHTRHPSLHMHAPTSQGRRHTRTAGPCVEMSLMKTALCPRSLITPRERGAIRAALFPPSTFASSSARALYIEPVAWCIVECVCVLYVCMYERGRTFRYMNTKNEASLDYESGGGEKVEKEREGERLFGASGIDRALNLYARVLGSVCVMCVMWTWRIVLLKIV